MKELYVEKFKGENFLSWKLRLKSKMGLMSSDYNVLFNYFEQAKFDKPINDNDFKKTDGSLDQEKIGLSKALKAYILCHCDYSIDAVLQADSTEHGFELWRRLRDRYDQVSDLSSMGRLTKILNMKFDENSLEDQLASWDAEVSKYQLETKSVLPDPILTATIINGTTGHLQQWIQLHSSQFKDYKALRDSVVSYARSRRFTSSLSTSTSMPTPMEIDGILNPKGFGKGKGKDKGKGKGKGKGSSKGKGPYMPSTPFDPQQQHLHQHQQQHLSQTSVRSCWNCGSKDHLIKDCPWNGDSTWSSWSTSSSDVFYDEYGQKWTKSDPMVGSIQQHQQYALPTTSSTSTASTVTVQPPQPIQERAQAIMTRESQPPGLPIVIRGSSPIREEDINPPSTRGRSRDYIRGILRGDADQSLNEFKQSIKDDINQEFKDMKNDIYERISELLIVSEEIKKKLYQDRVATVIQVDRLREDLRADLKSWREDLWYQCDHMKFVNVINSKFHELNQKMVKHIYEPNAEFYINGNDSKENAEVVHNGAESTMTAKDIYKDIEMLHVKVYETKD